MSDSDFHRESALGFTDKATYVRPEGHHHHMTPQTSSSVQLTLDDIVAIAAIVEGLARRPLTPEEFSRLKAAWTADPHLTDLADTLNAEILSAA